MKKKRVWKWSSVASRQRLRHALLSCQFSRLILSLSLSFFFYDIESLSCQRVILINLSHCRRMLFSLLSLSFLTLSLVIIITASWICLNYSTLIQVTLRCRASTVSAMMSFAITKWARRSAWAKRLLISLVSMMRRWQIWLLRKTWQRWVEDD